MYRNRTLSVACVIVGVLCGCSDDERPSVGPSARDAVVSVPLGNLRWSAGPTPSPSAVSLGPAAGPPLLAQPAFTTNASSRATGGLESQAASSLGSRRTDVVWQHSTTGDRGIWRLSGSTFIGWTPIGVVDPLWRIDCVASITGGAANDLVWTNTSTGERAVWGMSEGAFASYAGLPSTPAAWRISTCGDVNNDGRTDLLFTNTTTGERGAWLLNGTTVTSWLSWGVVPIEWQLVAVADLGGDAITDLIWSNTSTGERGAWILSGAQPVGWRGLGQVETSWQLLAVRPFDDDNEADLFWRYAPTGETGFWRLTNGSFAGWAGGPGAPDGWELGGVGTLFAPTPVATVLSVAQEPAGAASGSAFSTQPVVHVLDANGQRVTTGAGATIAVTISKASGPGTLSGTTTVNAVAGIAAFTDLTISGNGTYSLNVSAPGLTSTTSAPFTVAATAADVASITVSLPQPSVAGNDVQSAIATPRDASGNPVDVQVVWSVGNPLVARVTFTGSVHALGVGSTTIQASVNGVIGSAPISVAPRSGDFAIDLRYLTSVTPSVEAAFTAARQRWSTIIRGDLPNMPALDLQIDFCGAQPAEARLNEPVDDLLIYVRVAPIDGPGGVLGSAGPCWIRSGTTGLPFAGQMRFDEADLAALESNGTLNAVILHEMGHVLGIGTRWSPMNLLVDPAPSLEFPACTASDPIFVGANARWAFSLLGTDFTGRTVPVENCYGGGTRNGHWRESVVARELMTGFVSPTINPLSPLTILSLLDMGYVVDVSQADVAPWFERHMTEPLYELRELPPPPARVVGGR